ncbi:DUF4124 domain-containing protein [Xanthomonas sp. XNM01]|uniref:DUF4124 domain-containing protein n=1 Tax=Xanthomonas sp. XNM01 TaxID=2769289 RepID=UPI001785F262|nr:DUF4124 domain-containing protein [Xanthomonas sp. XNM01]MBD9368375.1 DUF4124 domain-containing protein [Xanthomonas sp. XNM01]
MLLALMPASVSAQQIFKCVKGGQVEYTSIPCAPGEAVEKVWAGSTYPTYAPPPAADVARNQQVQMQTEHRDQQLRQNPSRAVAEGAAIPIRAGACEEAKQARDRKLYALGAGVSIQVRRMFDEEVRRACRW